MNKMTMEEWWAAHDTRNMIRAGVGPMQSESEASRQYWQDFHQRLQEEEELEQ